MSNTVLKNTIIRTSPSNHTIINTNESDHTMVTICNGKQYELRRVCLPFVNIVFLLYLDILQTYVYLPIIIIVVSFIIFWNFPSLVYISNTRPLYYEDLFVDTQLFTDSRKLYSNALHPLVKKRFEYLFQWTLIITNTLFVGILADYWLYKTRNDEAYEKEIEEELKEHNLEILGHGYISQDYFEIIGITGGVLKIFQFINSTLGSMLLKFIRNKMKKESKRLRETRYSTKSQRNRILHYLTKKKAPPKKIEMITSPMVKHTVEESNEIIDNVKKQTNINKLNKSANEIQEWTTQPWNDTHSNNDNITIEIKQT